MSRLPTRCVAILLSVVLLNGCKTGGTVVIDHCMIDEPLTVVDEDRLTDETARGIEVHNIIWERVCEN